MTPSVKAHISLFLAQVIYALNYSIAKDLMPTFISPLALVSLRISGALLLFWFLSIFIKSEPIEKSDFKKLMLLALFGVAVNQVFFICGLNLTKPINSAIFMVSNPIAVMIFTLIVLKESITRNKIFGLLLGVVGATTLLVFKSTGNFSIGSDTIIGDLMTLVNSLSWAVFVVMAKPYMQKYHTVTVMKWIFLFGFIFVFPFGFPFLMDVNWSQLPLNIYGSLAFVVVATTFLAYLLNTYALKSLSSSVVSMYIYLQPFLATLIAVFLGKDNLTPVKILSAIFIISGVYLVSYRKSKV